MKNISEQRSFELKNKKHIITGTLLLLSAIILTACISSPTSGTPEETTFETAENTLLADYDTSPETEEIETEPIYELSTDPTLYEPLPEQEYGLEQPREPRLIFW